MTEEAKRLVTVLNASAGKCACAYDDGAGCVYDANDCVMEQAADLIERLSSELSKQRKEVKRWKNKFFALYNKVQFDRDMEGAD